MSSETPQFDENQRRLDTVDKKSDGQIFDIKSVSSTFFSQADQIQVKLEDTELQGEGYFEQSRQALDALFERAYLIGRSAVTENNDGISEGARAEIEAIASKMEREIYPEIERAFSIYQKIHQVEEFIDSTDSVLEHHQKGVIEGGDVLEELESIELGSVASKALLKEASEAENLFTPDEIKYNEDLAYRLQSQLENITQTKASIPYVEVSKAVFLAIETGDFRSVEAAFDFIQTTDSILPAADELRKAALEESRVFLDQWKGEKGSPVIYRQKYLELYNKSTSFESRYGLLLEQYNLEKDNGEADGAKICREKLKALIYAEKSLPEPQRGELLVEMEMLGGNSEKAQQLLDSLRARDDLTESDAENLAQKQLSMFIMRLQGELPENRKAFTAKFESLKSRQSSLNAEYIFLKRGETLADDMRVHRMDKDNMLRNMRDHDMKQELDKITIDILENFEQNILLLNNYLVRADDSLDYIAELIGTIQEPGLSKLKTLQIAIKKEKLGLVLELAELNARKNMEIGKMDPEDFNDFRKRISDVIKFTNNDPRDVHNRIPYERYGGNGSYDLDDIEKTFLATQTIYAERGEVASLFQGGVWQMYSGDRSFKNVADFAKITGIDKIRGFNRQNAKTFFNITRQVDRAIKAKDQGDFRLAKLLLQDIQKQIDRLPGDVRETISDIRYPGFKDLKVKEMPDRIDGVGAMVISEEFYLETLPKIAKTGTIVAVAVGAAVVTGGALGPILAEAGVEGVIAGMGVNLAIGITSNAAANAASLVLGDRHAFDGGLDEFLRQSIYNATLSFGVSAVARGIAPSLQFAAKSGLATKSAERFAKAVLALANGADYMTGGTLSRTYLTGWAKEFAGEYIGDASSEVHPALGVAMKLLINQTRPAI